jgi:hypothetical protein
VIKLQDTLAAYIERMSKGYDAASPSRNRELKVLLANLKSLIFTAQQRQGQSLFIPCKAFNNLEGPRAGP